MAQQEYIRKKEGSNIGKIVIDRDLCIGAGTCIALSNTTYELDQENKAVVIDAETADDDALRASAESCPTRAISLYDKQGKKIFP